MNKNIFVILFLLHSLLSTPIGALCRKSDEEIKSQLKVVRYVSPLIDNPLYSPFEKVTYTFSNDPIDVVIPCHKKDVPKLPLLIESIKENVIGLRRIIVVSAQPYTDQAEWFNEAYFPFTKKDIALQIFHNDAVGASEYLNHPKSRTGWILQQLIKLYAPLVIADISSNVLIVDADVVFLRPITFLQESGAALFNVGNEYHAPYFEHAQKVLPGLRKVFRIFSGISHYMLFQRCVIEDLLSMIENVHGDAAWKILCRFVQPQESSCLSEYEIYFNFVLLRCNQMKIRRLKWFNGFDELLGEIEIFRQRNYDYVAFHTYE